MSNYEKSYTKKFAPLQKRRKATLCWGISKKSTVESPASPLPEELAKCAFYQTIPSQVINEYKCNFSQIRSLISILHPHISPTPYTTSPPPSTNNLSKKHDPPPHSAKSLPLRGGMQERAAGIKRSFEIVADSINQGGWIIWRQGAKQKVQIRQRSSFTI